MSVFDFLYVLGTIFLSFLLHSAWGERKRQMLQDEICTMKDEIGTLQSEFYAQRKYSDACIEVLTIEQGRLRALLIIFRKKLESYQKEREENIIDSEEI